MYSVYLKYLIYMEAVKSKQVKLKSYTIICHRQISVTFYTLGKFQCFVISSIFAFSQSTLNFCDCVMQSDIEIKMHHQYT